MAVEDLTITSWAGNKRTIGFTVLDQDNGNAPKDLTGIEVRFAVSPINSSGDFSTTPKLDYDSLVNAGVTFPDRAHGQCQVNVAEGDTADMGGKDWYFELETYIPDVDSNVVATGTWTIKKNVVNT